MLHATLLFPHPRVVTFAAAAGEPIVVVLAALLVSFVVIPIPGAWLGRLAARWFLRGDGEPRCGACGYSVRGLTSMECPECGADLRDVGIVRRDPAGLWWTLIAWSLYIGALWLLALGVTLGMFQLAANDALLREHAWVPTSVCAAYGVAWAAGVLVVLRFQRRPVGWIPNPRPGDDATARPAAAAMTVSHAGTVGVGPASRVLTIMFIDMADYTSRVGGASRDGVIALVRQVRELVKPAVAARHGRIVKTMGDGFLVTFESATDALLAGRAVQQEARNAGEHGISLRIGVTTGEVAIEEDDVYGEPVNLAARIQQLARSGEVYFSAATWHAMTKNEVRHEEAGELEFKGIAEKVRLFRVI